jgi:hypothetical protein
VERVFQHLRAAVRGMQTSEGSRAEEITAFVEQFHDEVGGSSQTIVIPTGYPPRLVLNAAEFLLRAQGFDLGKGADALRGLIQARISRDFGTRPNWLSMVQSGRATWRLTVELTLQVDAAGHATVAMTPPIASWLAELRKQLHDMLAQLPAADVERARVAEAALARPVTGDTVLLPGEPLSAPYTGTLRDYSGCATLDEVADLAAGSDGVLPLGRWAFHHPESGLRTGAPLRLASIARGGRRFRREHQGALICAPQNAGKTELLVRWARAANAAGYNLLIVDVKGNMLDKLRDGYRWRGKLFHVTTDPLAMPGVDAPCHALNVLDGLDPRSRLVLQRVRQIAEALLPAEGLDRGETRVWRSNWLNWLSALIHLVLLDQFYWPMDDRSPDLSDVYALASDERRLIECLERIDRGERVNLAKDAAPLEPGLASWFSDLAVLLPQKVIIAANEALGRPALEGARAEYSFRWLTEQLTSALRPFRQAGLLYDKASGRPGIPRIRLERLAGLDESLQPTAEQVTLVLAAREQELDEAQTMLTLVIVKLQHSLYERMRHTRTRQLTPVLLLLDETRRIRNFRTNEYVSFAREAEAGCVVVFQFLDQVGNERQIRELLGNIGTQIYLGSLTGSTARHFVDCLPTRDRSTFAITTGGVDGVPALQIGKQQVPYFSTADLHVLPAGSYPAIVYLRQQPARSPILTAMDQALDGSLSQQERDRNGLHL